MNTRNAWSFPAALALLAALFAPLHTSAMTEEEEILIGRQAHAQILRQYRVYKDEKLHDYVRAVGSRLAAVGERPELKYTFTVLDSPEVNAFAAPGGYIYVTRGLMSYLNSEAELAAVLGHEIGHVALRHAARGERNSQLTNVLGTLLAVATGVPGAIFAGDLAGSVLTAGYGRGLELEADEAGARYLAATGYAPEAMIDVIRVLKDQEIFEIKRAEIEGREPNVYHGVFASHPSADTRLQEVVKKAGKAKESAEGEVLNEFTFLNFSDGMMFGMSPAEPRRARGEQHNPDMGVGLRVPLGWIVKMGKNQILAESTDSDAVLQVKAYKNSRVRDPKDVLVRRVGRDTTLLDAYPVDVNGFPGFTAIAERATSPFGPRNVRYGVVLVGDQAYIFAGAVQSTTDQLAYDAEFKRAITSLRLLTSKERDLARPRIIRLERVQPGMTFAYLAATSRLPHFAEEQLRLINGMFPEGEPEPGSYVKVLE
ncbi:MAG: M48 family metalloprotease [Pseudomonadota bacterium]